MAKKAAYVVFVGRKPGIYDTWQEAEQQVTGFRGAVHRGYTNADEAARAWKYGSGPNGGHGYIHARGIECGHWHGKEVRNWNVVTCPACRRSMDGLEPPPPKVKKEKPPPPKYRVYNLKTAAWASEQRHDTYQLAMNEKIARVQAADPRVKDWARVSLIMVREDDDADRTKRQAIYDSKYPHIAAKRGIAQ